MKVNIIVKSAINYYDIAEKIFSCLVFSFIASFLPIQLHDEAVLYVLSSIFQGLSAILGLQLIAYIYFREQLWSYRQQRWKSSADGSLHSFFDEPETRQAIIETEKESTTRFLNVVALLSIAIIVSLIELSIAPIMVSLFPRYFGVFALVLCITLAIWAIIDLVLFIFWGVRLIKIQVAMIQAETRKGVAR